MRLHCSLCIHTVTAAGAGTCSPSAVMGCREAGTGALMFYTWQQNSKTVNFVRWHRTQCTASLQVFQRSSSRCCKTARSAHRPRATGKHVLGPGTCTHCTRVCRSVTREAEQVLTALIWQSCRQGSASLNIKHWLDALAATRNHYYPRRQLRCSIPGSSSGPPASACCWQLQARTKVACSGPGRTGQVTACLSDGGCGARRPESATG